jgi:antitoxin MazE
MKTRLVKIGNSQGILLSKSFLQHYQFENEVELLPQSDGLLIKSVEKSPRYDWELRFQKAIKDGHVPDNELLEGFENTFENTEWTW